MNLRQIFVFYITEKSIGYLFTLSFRFKSSSSCYEEPTHSATSPLYPDHNTSPVSHESILHTTFFTNS